MTSRLEDAIKRLPPEKVDQVADYAEALARQLPLSSTQAKHLDLGWLGAAAKLSNEFKSGVEAAHAAASMIAESEQRNRPR